MLEVQNKEEIVMEKKGVGKFSIRVWGWPTLILCLLQWTLMAVFKLTSTDRSKYFLEPESGREVLFEILLGFFFIGYLWVLIFRYSKMTENKLSFIAKCGAIFLMVMFILGSIGNLVTYLVG